MAKSKKSKILAMALCASVMAGIYASPVMAANIKVEEGSTLNGVAPSSSTDYTITSGTLKLDGADIANALNGKNINLGTGSLIINNQNIGNSVAAIRRVVNKDAGMSATYLEETVKAHSAFGLQVLDENEKAVATISRGGSGTFNGTVTTRDVNSKAHSVLSSAGLQLYNAGGTSKVNITNTGASRFGAFDETSVRIENGQLQIRAANTAKNADSSGPLLASLSEKGLTLVDDERNYFTLSATRLGTINDVITKEGAVKSKGDVTSTAADGTTYSLNTVGNNTAGIRREIDDGGHKTIIEEQLVVNRDSQVISNIGGSFTVDGSGNLVASTLGNKSGTFGVNGEGAVKAADGKFNVGADGDVAIQYAEDGAIVADENGFAVQKGSAQTVVTNSGIANVYGDNSVNVNADGVGIAAGKDNTLTVTDSGVGMKSGTSQVVVNSADGAVFHNGEGSGHTLINGGNISTYSINADVLNGKKVNDLVVGSEIADDLDNIAGIERKTNDTAASTYIEKTVRVNTESGLVVYAKDGTTFAAQIDREGNGTFTGDVKVDGNVLTEGAGRFGSLEGANVRMENGVLTINSNATNAVAKLDADGLMLSDAASGEQTLTATKIADIDSITRNGNTTPIEGVLNVSDDGSISAQYADDGAIVANENGFAVQKGAAQTVVTNVGVANIYDDNRVEVNANGVGLAAGLKADGSAAAQISVTDDGIGLQGGTSEVVLNSNNGAVFTNGEGNGETVINGGSVTTGTITADDLHVDNIYLGNQIVDEEGNVVGSDLAIGADGSIKIADNFEVDTDNLAAHYVGEDGEYELTLDGTNGFALRNSEASLTLNGKGYAFSGPVNLGAASDVKFGYTGNLGGYTENSSYSLSQLVDTVNDIYNRTDGIYKDADGNTVISNEKGTWNEETKQTEYEGTGSKVTVGDNGTTFENGKGNGTTNINGSEIVSDATNVESGSGSGSGFGGGTSTTNGDNAVYVGEDGDYTHVSSDGVTIGDKTNTNTTNIDKDGMVVNGSNGTTHISDSGMTVTGENGTNNISDSGMTITGKDGNTTNNISDKGMTVTGSNGTTNISGGDISVDNSVTVAGGSENKTTINNEGITVGDKGTSIKHDEISVGDGGYIGDGDVRSGEGVSLNQTAERVGHLENRVGELEDRIDKVGAMAAAIANLRTMGYDPAAPTEVAVGIGQYRDETGAALGLFHYPNRDFMLSLSVSTSGDEVMGGIGATWKFGRKSPEKVAEIKKAQAEADARRAEEAKLAKAEEMKQAAKEAKIKAQQERHAKLAAERAAQAEAAK